MTPPASAFLSYVHFDDEHDVGKLSLLSKRLSGEVQVQRGEPIEIFHDRTSIGWGDAWRSRIEKSLDGANLLIPVITPGYFKSRECRTEFERFLKREQELRRCDLILPLYYVEAPVLNDETARAADPIAAVVAARQYSDWRELRFEPLDSPVVNRTLAKMARQIIATLDAAQSDRQPADSSRAKSDTPALVAAATPPRTPIVDAVSGAATPSPKTAPPTCVVDPRSPGSHATLAEAIDAVSPGGRILVRPGRYRESVVIEKPLEIVGDGERSDIVIEAYDRPVILFRATMGRVTNLTLRQLQGASAFAIDIAQGRLDIESCDITSMSLACVAIHEGADPRLRRNRIHHGREQGVLLYSGGLGTIEDNEVFANGGSGLEIRAGSRPTVRSNRIYDGSKGGVFVLDSGEGTLEDNELFGNAFAAVEISTGADPALRRNRIHDSTSGIFVNENGRGTVEDNEISRSSMAGVVVTTGGNPRLLRNAIHHGQDSGVLVAAGGRGELAENQVFENEGAGVAVNTGGDPILRRNRIFGNRYGAIWVYQSGRGTFEDNDLSGNGRDAWDISEDSASAVIRRGNTE
jgi:F-box protein 11